MGMRFRKSVKICKGVKVNFSKSGASLSLGGRGHSVNVGRRGTRVTAGIPGTGLSYSTKIGGSGSKSRSSNGSARKSTSATHRATNNTVHTKVEFNIHMDDNGKITIFDHGREVTDPAMLRKIKAAPEFIAMKEQLERQRQMEIDNIIRNSEAENERYLNIYKHSAMVDSKEQFLQRLNELKPETYHVEVYSVPAPKEEDIRELLTKEAQDNVKASIFTVGKQRRQYVEDRIQERLEQATNAWNQDRIRHEQEQERIRRDADAEYQKQYESQKNFLLSLIVGDDSAVCEVFDDWIASCELPVEMNVDYDWDSDTGILMLDIDLPEIEDIPATKMTKTSAGNLKEKKKTQSELRGEYATLVFGLAIFVSSNAFNTSPAINKILISGYTQRRDKDGNMNDDYIYSVKFYRAQFEKINLSVVIPKDFCMSFENRCNMTTTSLFKAIKPFEEF